MLKKCLTAMLACSFITGSLKTEETSGSYLKQAWNILKKKITTIAQYGDEEYLAACGACSMASTATGLNLWLTRNSMVERALRDANGNPISNMDELCNWVQKIRANGADVAKVILSSPTKSETISTAGESFTYTVASKLEPFSSSLEYKIILGIAGITGLIALYSAYKLFNTPDRAATEATPES